MYGGVGEAVPQRLPPIPIPAPCPEVTGDVKKSVTGVERRNPGRLSLTEFDPSEKIGCMRTTSCGVLVGCPRQEGDSVNKTCGTGSEK